MTYETFGINTNLEEIRDTIKTNLVDIMQVLGYNIVPAEGETDVPSTNESLIAILLKAEEYYGDLTQEEFIKKENGEIDYDNSGNNSIIISKYNELAFVIENIEERLESLSERFGIQLQENTFSKKVSELEDKTGYKKSSSTNASFSEKIEFLEDSAKNIEELLSNYEAILDIYNEEILSISERINNLYYKIGQTASGNTIKDEFDNLQIAIFDKRLGILEKLYKISTDGDSTSTNEERLERLEKLLNPAENSGCISVIEAKLNDDSDSFGYYNIIDTTAVQRVKNYVDNYLKEYLDSLTYAQIDNKISNLSSKVKELTKEIYDTDLITTSNSRIDNAINDIEEIKKSLRGGFRLQPSYNISTDDIGSGYLYYDKDAINNSGEKGTLKAQSELDSSLLSDEVLPDSDKAVKSKAIYKHTENFHYNGDIVGFGKANISDRTIVWDFDYFNSFNNFKYENKDSDEAKGSKYIGEFFIDTRVEGVTENKSNKFYANRDSDIIQVLGRVYICIPAIKGGKIKLNLSSSGEQMTQLNKSPLTFEGESSEELPKGKEIIIDESENFYSISFEEKNLKRIDRNKYLVLGLGITTETSINNNNEITITAPANSGSLNLDSIEYTYTEDFGAKFTDSKNEFSLPTYFIEAPRVKSEEEGYNFQKWYSCKKGVLSKLF